MISLKDPLYGFINIDEPFKSLIETEQFQRLRNIKQLGQSYLIYPSANHSRFEHSIGAFYLAKRIIEKLSTESGDSNSMNFSYQNEFMAAALLHDIGHYPFSHSIERSIGLANGATHEQQAIKIIGNTDIGKIITKAKMNLDIICDLIEGRGKFGKLIAGQIDIDRLDYLKRDSYYTGVAYGVIDTDIIIKSLTMKDKKYSVDEKFFPAFESILFSRYLMYTMVYMHRKTLIANNMLRAAFQEVLTAGEIAPSQLSQLDDIDFVSILRSSKTEAKNLIKQINNRKFYKKAIIFRKEDFGENIDKIKKIKNIAEIEKNIADELKTQNFEILINILKIPVSNKSEIIINPSGQSLEKISPMIGALNSAEWNHWFVGVYCPEKHLDKVIKAKKMIKESLLT